MNDPNHKAYILFVEDHSLIAGVISRFLRQTAGLQVDAVANSAEAALQQLADLSPTLPDLVLIDVSLPDMSGIELVAILQEKYPSLPCLMLSGHREPRYVEKALEAGARGYVTKDNPLAIAEAVRQVLQGEIYLSEDLRE